MENLNSTPDVDKTTKPVEEIDPDIYVLLEEKPIEKETPRTVNATIYPIEEVTHADESPRLRVAELIERGNVTADELNALAEYVKSVKALLPIPKGKQTSESEKGVLYYILNDGVQSLQYDEVIEIFKRLCEKLAITPSITYNFTAENQKRKYYDWHLTPIDFLKFVRYTAETYGKHTTSKGDNTSTPFCGESLNYGIGILQPTDAEIESELSAVNSMSYSERDQLRRKINLIDLRGIFQLDRQCKGFICPICGNGSGDSGDGVIMRLMEDTDGNNYITHTCFKCGGFNGKLNDIIANVNGLNWNAEKTLAIGLHILHLTENSNYSPPPVEFTVKSNEISQEELALIAADITDAQDRLAELPIEDRRGLSLNTLRRFQCGYLPNWIHTKNRIKNENLYPSRRLIIPTSSRHYVAVMLKSDRTAENKRYWKMHGGNKEIFNVADISPNAPVFVLEGEIDAMSILQATQGKYHVIALGGAGEKNSLPKLLNSKDLPIEDSLKYFFVILFDSDDAGRDDAPKLVKELIQAGYPAICKFLSDGESKLDANDILVNQGDAALKARIDEIISTALPELAAIKESIVQARLIPSADEKATSPVQVDSEDPIQKIKAQLQWARDSHGHPTHVKGTQKNLNLIFDQDPLINGLIGYDEFYEREVLLKSVAWNKNGAGTEWTDTDDAHLYCYLRDTYTEIKGKDSIRDTVIVYSRKNSFHPVKNYLESLVWDGISRAEEFFIKFLKVEDSPYSREVTLKWLLGAVARVYYPGCDFQSALVLQGNQGIGKGFSARMLGKKWHITLDDNVDDSHALDAIRSAWICEIEEMSAVRKAEINAVKSFLSRGIDTRRAAYERRERQFRRHCVFIITVNDSQFLRDHTGNRRFKILKCNNAPKEFVEGLTSEYVDQVWAEVFHRYQLLFADGFNPALLMLSRESEILSEEIAEGYLMDDGMKGEIENFLATKILPSYIWELLTKEERRRFISNASIDLKLQDINLRIRTRYGKNQNAAQIQVNSVDSYIRENSNHAIAKIEPADFKKPNAPRNEDGIFYRFYGTVERVATCASEIFNECFGNDKRKSMARINEILSMLEGWTLDGKQKNNFAGCYGRQKKIYSR